MGLKLSRADTYAVAKEMRVIKLKQYGCFKLVYFSKKSGRLSSVNPENLDFVSHWSANLQPILDCFIPNLKLSMRIQTI